MAMNLSTTSKTVAALIADQKVHWPITIESSASLTPLTGGLTNTSYIISSSNIAYVLRLNNPDSQQLGINRIFEYMAQQRAAELKLSPQLIYTGLWKEQHYSLRHYQTDGDTLQQEISEQQLITLANCTAQLHQIEFTDFSQYQLSILDRCDNLWNSIDQQSIQLRQLRQQLETVFKQDYQSAMGLCHFDLIKQNLLFNQDKVMVIDWEYAAISDQYFDLACIISSFELNEVQQQVLLENYFHFREMDFSYFDKKRLALNLLACQYLSILWYAAQPYDKEQHDQQQLIDDLNQLLVTAATI